MPLESNSATQSERVIAQIPRLWLHAKPAIARCRGRNYSLSARTDQETGFAAVDPNFEQIEGLAIANGAVSLRTAGAAQWLEILSVACRPRLLHAGFHASRRPNISALVRRNSTRWSTMVACQGQSASMAAHFSACRGVGLIGVLHATMPEQLKARIIRLALHAHRCGKAPDPSVRGLRFAWARRPGLGMVWQPQQSRLPFSDPEDLQRVLSQA